MQRRDFVKVAGAVAAYSAICSDRTSTQLNAAQAVQGKSEDVYVEPFTSEVMTGFPSKPVNQVTLENYVTSQPRLRWAQMHMRELQLTQPVTRGNAEVAVINRNHRADFNALKITDLGGKLLSVGDMLRRLETDAFLVIKNGEILTEQYYNGMSPATSHILFSAIKSLEACVIGKLLEQGKLKENELIESYVPELRDSGLAGATIRHLLDMRSGCDYPLTEFARQLQSEGPAAAHLSVPIGSYNYLLNLKRARPHGKSMVYKNADPAALVWAAEKVTGVRFADLFSRELWSQLGCENDTYVTCDALGTWTGGVPLTLRDFARWGLMCLNKGRANGRQVVPLSFFKDVLDHSHADIGADVAPLCPEGTEYRSFFWVLRKHGAAIAASGAYGKTCYMHYDFDVVIAWYSTFGAIEKGLDKIDANAIAQFRKPYLEQYNACHQIAKAVGG